MRQTQIETPAWVRDAVFYQIFPDRFAMSAAIEKPRNLETWDSTPTHHGFKGGDMIGALEHLDYLVELGITAIYFNPVFQSAANHRYHTYDYYNIDPILGGNEAFRRFLDGAHSRGIRVILDGVFNHSSRGFFQFNHLLENGPYSPYTDWFCVRAWPLNAYETSQPPNYDAWWNLPALPKFNTDNNDVREFLFGVAEHWVRFGVDGWRLDVPSEISDDAFWREFRRRVKAVNPEAYIVGEIWHDASHWLRGDQFDAVMNYLFTKLCMEFFIDEPDGELLRGTTLWPLQARNPQQFADGIEALLKMYPRAVTEVQFNLLDSHDTARFITVARGDETALRLSMLMEMIMPGTPCIYYGDEVGMSGGRDPFCRGAFPWDESKWNVDLRNYVKKVITLRKAHPALRTGDYRTLYSQDSMYAAGRSLGDDKVIMVFNAGRAVAGAKIPVGELFPDGTALCDCFKKDRYVVKDGQIDVHVLPRSGVALEVDGTQAAQ